ncbi:MAG TPA: YdcF family protein [Zeimonas sp.]|nr:YdcF family protein [Zeimonas sp.]
MSPAELVLAARRGAELLLLPPAAPLLLIAVGLAWSVRRARAGRVLATIGLVLAVLTSSQVVGQWLIGFVERNAGAALDADALRASLARPDAPSAIVILGGGSRFDPRERPDPERPNPRTTERVLHGAWVARVTGLPVLVSGGALRRERTPEARLMRRMLERRLAVPVRWIEDRSRDTEGNARESARLLLPAGHRRVLLVTHAYHMPRALAAFRRAGFDPVGVPHGFLGTPNPATVHGWLPSAQGANVNWLAAHEAVGGLWYRLRSALSSAPPIAHLPARSSGSRAARSADDPGATKGGTLP